MIPGMIAMWSGSIASIPAGYALCDGNNGTPDLRDQFIRGAGGTKNPGDIGGFLAHSHSFTGDGHDHFLKSTPDQIEAGTYRAFTTSDEPAEGDTDTENVLPPYYALAYIMML